MLYGHLDVYHEQLRARFVGITKNDKSYDPHTNYLSDIFRHFFLQAGFFL